MKLKKNVIITFFVVMFVLLFGVYLVKNKDITYKNISSHANKYLISYNTGYTTTATCDRYYEGIGTKIFKMDEVDERFPMFVVNDCATGADYYIEQTGDKNAVCDALETYAQANRASSAIVNNYNNICGTSLNVSYSGYNCSEAYDKITNNYIDYLGLYDWYIGGGNCGTISLNNINKNDYFLEEGNCETKRIYNNNANSFDNLGYTGVLRRSMYNSKNNGYENACDYRLFYVNGYATTFDDYVSKVGRSGLETYCNSLYNEVKGYADNRDSDNFYAANYDYKMICVDTGIKTETINSINLCNYRDYVSSGNYNISSNSCENSSNPFFGTNVVLKSSAVSTGNPLYLVQGCPWAFEDIFTDASNSFCLSNNSLSNENEKFKREVCQAQKEFLNPNYLYDEEAIDEYNEYCSELTGNLYSQSVSYDYIRVIFKANNAYGLECSEYGAFGDEHFSMTTDNNECTYYYKKDIYEGESFVTINRLPDTSDLYQLTTNYRFSGWKRNSETSCNTGSAIEVSLSNNITEITYEACFSGEESQSLGYTLYNSCDGSYKNGTSSTNIPTSTTGSVNVDNIAVLTSSVRATQEYITENVTENSVSVTKGESTFNINQYCKIKCTESFNYSYPTIFETVKSGTYFELLSYPEVYSSLTCSETFGYDGWKRDYDDKIKAEKKAYVNYLNDNSIDNMNLNGNGENCTYSGYEYTSNEVSFYVYDDQNNKIIESSRTFTSDCKNNTSDGLSNIKQKAREVYDIDSSFDYYQAYQTAYNARKDKERANVTCYNALYQTTTNDDFVSNNYTFDIDDTDKFYNVNTSNVSFYYESDSNSNNNVLTGDSNSYYQEVLEPSNKYAHDTGVVDANGNENSPQNDSMVTISYDDAPLPSNFSSTFSPRTNANMSRTVTRSYVYNYSRDHSIYYSEYQTGGINDDRNGIYLGYVYPVKLTLSGTRNVYFAINANTNLNYGASQLLNGVPNNVNAINVYKCDYDISNDIIVEDTDGEYKKNFYIRSVSTQDVDPNDRFSSGTLGANWATDKGQDLIEIIQKKSEGKNTYNPENLEYSFTLNAQTIEAIRQYNEQQSVDDGLGYSDFNLTCNNMGGECKSEFLDGLKDGNIKGISVSNVNTVMNRESWKYYIDGSWMKTKSLTGSSNWMDILNSTTKSASEVLDGCSNSSAKNTYDCIYRNMNEGMLP